MDAGAIRAGIAYVEALWKDVGLRQGIRGAEGMLQRFGTTVQSIGMQMVRFGSMLSLPFVGAIKAASDANETASKFTQVFGAQAGAAEGFVQDLARTVGRSTTELREGMSAFQSIFAGNNFDPKQAREMSQTLQRLAVDLASFHNISDAEAMEKFRSAMAGMARPLLDLGINIHDAQVQEEMLANATIRAANATEEQRKIMARMAIIERSMGQQGAVGDAVRTADQFANRLRALKSAAMEAAVAVGEGLIGPLADVAGKLTRGLFAAVEWIRENKGIVIVAASAALAITSTGAALVALGVAAKVSGFALGTLRSGLLGLTGLLSPIGLIGTAIAGIGAYLYATADDGGRAARQLNDSLDTVSRGFARVGDAARSSWETVSEAPRGGPAPAAAEASPSPGRPAPAEAPALPHLPWEQIATGAAAAGRAVASVALPIPGLGHALAVAGQKGVAAFEQIRGAAARGDVQPATTAIERLGSVMDQVRGFAKQAWDGIAGDAVRGALTGVAVGAAIVVQGVRALAQGFRAAVGWISGFVGTGRDALVTGKSLGEMLAVDVTRLGMFAGAIVAAKVAIFGLGVVVSTVMAVWGGIAAVISPFLALMAAVSLPVKGLILAFTGLTASLVYFGMKASLASQDWSFFGRSLGQIGSMVRDSIGVIMESLQGGNFTGAMQVAGATLKAVWAEALATMAQSWELFKAALSGGQNEIASGITVAWLESAHSFRKFWRQAIDGYRILWINFVSFFQALWNNAIAAVQTSWVKARAMLPESLGGLSAEDRDRRIGEINEQRDRDNSTIEANREGEIVGIHRRNEADERERNRRRQAEIDAIGGNARTDQEALNREARRRAQPWQDAARRAQEEADAVRRRVARDNFENEMWAQLAEMFGQGPSSPSRGLEQAQQQRKAIGTFAGGNAANLAFGGGGGVQEKQLDQLQRLRELVQKEVEQLIALNQNVQNGGLVFG